MTFGNLSSSTSREHSQFQKLIVSEGDAQFTHKKSLAERGHSRAFNPSPKALKIPFRYVNGFLVVDIVVNRRLPLSFIFDTGSKHTILTEDKLVPLLGQVPQEEIQLIGSDLGRPITGKIMRRTTLKIGSVNLENQSLIVINDNVLDLNGLTGEKIQGIFGVGAFGAYALKIDYKRHLIELLDPESVVVNKRTVLLPIRVEKSKAYLDVIADIHPGRKQKLSLLIDTGASLSLLINTPSSDSTLFPPKLVSGTFGYGLGGYLLGYVGRSDHIMLGPFDIPDVITHFHTIPRDTFYRKLPSREGILGNGILDNYTFIINFSKRELLLKPTKKKRKQHPYDRSGMRLIRDGQNLNKIKVHHIVANSPADRAGVRIGDEILNVQGIPISFKGLSQTEKSFRSRVGKKIRVKLMRKGEVIKTHFSLEKLI